MECAPIKLSSNRTIYTAPAYLLISNKFIQSNLFKIKLPVALVQNPDMVLVYHGQTGIAICIFLIEFQLVFGRPSHAIIKTGLYRNMVAIRFCIRIGKEKKFSLFGMF